MFLCLQIEWLVEEESINVENVIRRIELWMELDLEIHLNKLCLDILCCVSLPARYVLWIIQMEELSDWFVIWIWEVEEKYSS